MLFGPWDKVAVQPTVRRRRGCVGWITTRALLDTGAPTRFFMQDESHPAGLIGALLAAGRASPRRQGGKDF
jgi:hypothetical protein